MTAGPPELCRGDSLDYSPMNKPLQSSFLWQNSNSPTLQHHIVPLPSCKYLSCWSLNIIYLPQEWQIPFCDCCNFFLISQTERNLVFPDGPMFFTSWSTKGTSSINFHCNKHTPSDKEENEAGGKQNFVPTFISLLKQSGVTGSKHFFFPCNFLLFWTKVFHAT